MRQHPRGVLLRRRVVALGEVDHRPRQVELSVAVAQAFRHVIIETGRPVVAEIGKLTRTPRVQIGASPFHPYRLGVPEDGGLGIPLVGLEPGLEGQVLALSGRQLEQRIGVGLGLVKLPRPQVAQRAVVEGESQSRVQLEGAGTIGNGRRVVLQVELGDGPAYIS